MTRCPACGASNPEGAAWCNQCYADLAPRPAEAPAAPGGTGAPTGQPRSGGEAGLDLGAEDTTTFDLGAGDRPAFRRGEGGFEWACPRCGTYTSLDARTCVECGTPISELGADRPGPPPTANWQAAFLLSAALPGAGHMGMSRVGQGVARAVLYVLWLVSGLLAMAGGGALASVPLLLGAAALWVTGLVDLQRLREGRPELLTGRVLLWLVVAVIGLTFAALLGTLPRLGGP